MVGVRRVVLALLVLGLAAAGAVGWWLLTSEDPADSRGAGADSACAETVDGDTTPPEAGLLVCRYDGDGVLDRSALLEAEQVAQAETDLAAGATGDPGCVAEAATPPTALLLTPDHRAVVALDRVCPTYTLDGGEPRRLTPTIRAWARVETG